MKTDHTRIVSFSAVSMLASLFVFWNVHASASVTLIDGAFPDPVNVGGTLRYTLTVTNDGPAEAVNVLVLDALPPSVNFVSVSNTVGIATQSVGVVTWSLGTMSSGAVETATIVVTPTATGSITNGPTISLGGGAQSGPATVLITVDPAGPDLSASMELTDTTCTNTTKAANCSLAGTIELLNNGTPYLDADVTFSQSSKLPPKVGTKLAGTVNLTHFDLTGIPSHTIGFYLSSDSTLDPSDTLVAAATTKLLQAAFSRGMPAKVKFKVPSGVSVSGKFLILVVDATHMVSESNESNNTAVIGPLP